MLKYLSNSLILMNQDQVYSENWGRRYEYLLTVSPGGHVYEKLVEEKKRFSALYQQPNMSNTRPYIGISLFNAAADVENMMIRWIQRAVGQQQCFEVLLNNYSGIPADTLVLRVQYKHPFTELIQRLKPVSEHLKVFGVPAFRFCATPYLSIARNLPETVYVKALWDYAQREFVMKFDVHTLTLLRRPIGSYEPYRVAAILCLQPGKGSNIN